MKMTNEFCPNNCEHLSITEEKQNFIHMIAGIKPQHRCSKYIKPLYHMLAHPKLYKCEECYQETCSEK
jgi:hypothetical protein